MQFNFLREFNIQKIAFIIGICIFLLMTVILTGCYVEDPRAIHLNQTTKQVMIDSTFVGDTFPIYISLPQDYYDNPGIFYDVVYLLDGDWYFTETQKMICSHVANNEMRPVILVGIGNSAQRNRDYTPTNVIDYPITGGGPKFAAFIKDELIPYIDFNYRTVANPANRCLAGHSLGGLFAYYALFFYNDTFNKIIAASSYLCWDNGVTFQYEADFAGSHTALPVMFYTTICTGDYSLNPYQNEMLKRLKSRNYAGFILLSDSFEGDSHIYSWKPSFDNGLTRFFQ
ncbi:MAG: hypothetical protein K6U80_05120 [Firmicutes bacterium]|nr:hypothetical protein [Bacillota bacterium]